MKKIVQVLLICLIIAGIIVISTAGFNVGLKYSEHTEISINVGSQFNVLYTKHCQDHRMEMACKLWE